MTDANKKVFAKLAAAAGDVVDAETRREKRCIATNDTDKTWLQEVKLDLATSFSLGLGTSFLFAQFNNETYLIVIGVSVRTTPNEMEPVRVGAGLFTVLVAELYVPLIPSKDLHDQLKEYVFYPVSGGKVERIEVEVVSQFFVPICAYKVANTSALLQGGNASRAAIAAVLNSPAATIVNWGQEALDRAQRMIYDARSQIPFHLVARALTEYREDNAFLAVYRCIEQLFPLPKMQDLLNALDINKPAIQIAALVEQHLGWRRREEDAIAFLFEALPRDLCKRLAHELAMPLDSEHLANRVSRRIYELRNQCVHFRPIHAAGATSNDWNSWLSASELLLEVVEYLYAAHADAFDQTV